MLVVQIQRFKLMKKEILLWIRGIILNFIHNIKNPGEIHWGEYYYHFSFTKDAPTYYIIRRCDTRTGLFSLVETILGHINYALANGYVPVVDMKNHPNCYLEAEKLGLENSWEYYFEQPMGVSLEEAYKGKKVLMCDGSPMDPFPNVEMSFFNNEDGMLDFWKEFSKQYLRIKPDIMSDIMKEYYTLVNKEDRVLGGLCRGTDYLRRKPANHAVQPELSELFLKSKAVMKKYNCNKILVVTEDSEMASCFKKEFGEAYFTNHQELLNYDEELGISEQHSKRENDYFLRGKEYLAGIVMLAKCNCFVAGRTSGTVGVELLTDGFEYQYVYDLGVYR